MHTSASACWLRSGSSGEVEDWGVPQSLYMAWVPRMRKKERNQAEALTFCVTYPQKSIALLASYSVSKGPPTLKRRGHRFHLLTEKWQSSGRTCGMRNIIIATNGKYSLPPVVFNFWEGFGPRTHREVASVVERVS